MSGYVHGDLLTSRARGWGRAKEEIVPFFFLALRAHALSNGRKKKTKTKERNKDRKEKNNFC